MTLTVNQADMSHDSSKGGDKNGYQVFEVCKDRCQVLTVTVVRGRGITRGRIKDWLYSPDPYVTVQVLGTPNGLMKTKHISNNSQPEWNETFEFYIDPKRDHLIEFVLYDLNRTVNEEIGREVFDFYGFPDNVENSIVISYKNGSKIDIQLKHQINASPSLRLGLDLCADEKVYLRQRKPKVLAGLSAFLQDQEDQPESLSDCPTICLMTSGGGFRAMIAYCGVYKALEDAGLIDCVTYTSALSGSSWYLATLYSHPDFPDEPKVSHKIIPEIRSCVEKYWQVHLSPPWSSKYLQKIITKSMRGQPVSFTDFYGYLVGQQLLKGRMKARLSDQADKIQNGQVPMPMYTCLHVKSNVSAKIFQEWYEFTPYEVGIPKYGVFFRTSDFASKFYMGQKVKSFPEVRLHFLYGIWGSAFTILFKRLLQEKGRNSQGEILKMILNDPSDEDEEEVKENDEDIIVRCLENHNQSVVKQHEKEAQIDLGSEPDDEIIFCDPIRDDVNGDICDLDNEDQDNSKHKKLSFFRKNRQLSLPKINFGAGNSKNSDRQMTNSKTSPNFHEDLKSEEEDLGIQEQRSTRWNTFLERALTTSPLDSRAFRAGVILNPLRGLTMEENATVSVDDDKITTTSTTEGGDEDFKDFRKSMKTHNKKIYLVDSGLSFNLPYPLTLRPQRGIELYITFDFSSRSSDSTPPFRELLLAEKWALLHNVPFPKIKETAKKSLQDGVKECYVFKEPENPNVPVVIFFPLVNKDFRKFKTPGVPRETEAEINFGNFDIFDNTNAYAIWRFVYPNLSFDRMTAMMEFNILNNLHVIKSEMAELVKRKKSFKTKNIPQK